MGRVKLDHNGLEAILTGAGVTDWVDATAEAVADTIRSEVDAEVTVDAYDYQGKGSKRAARSITVKDPMALSMQATDGLFTRAAAEHGLEVTER